MPTRKDSPDDRLKLELRRIANGDYEGPDQRAHARTKAIGERLSVELPRLAEIARVPPDQRERFGWAVLNVVLDAWENNDAREAASKLPSNSAPLSRAVET